MIIGISIECLLALVAQQMSYSRAFSKGSGSTQISIPRFFGWPVRQACTSKGSGNAQNNTWINESIKLIEAKYLMIEALSPTTMPSWGRPSHNLLGVIMSTLHLSLKYYLPNGKVTLVHGVRGVMSLPRNVIGNNLEMSMESISW